MLIYLMRHGIAIDRTDPDCPEEAERYLTPEGIEKTREAARGLRALGLAPDAALSSPYRRATQTAEIACEALGFSKKKIRQTEALLPEADPAELFDELASLGAREAICFGHAPHVDAAIARALGLSADATSLKKAGVAGLEMASLNPPRGTLTLIFSPKALRLMGG